MEQTWDKAMESRPPLQVDMDGPGPTSYRPRNKPLYETNAPSFTFGRKSPPRNGGGRTAWATPWMQSESGFTKKTNFEKTWPTPVHYPNKHEKLALVGKRQVHLPTYPQFSLGARREFVLSKKGSNFEPSPNEYNISSAKVVVLPKAPSFSATPRRGTLWEKKSETPGPGTYSPSTGWTKRHNPAFTMDPAWKDIVVGFRHVTPWELTNLFPGYKYVMFQTIRQNGAEVVEEWTGFRPMRDGGIRLERETLTGTSTGRPLEVVHNYGHGENGVTWSHGCAKEVADIVKTIMAERRPNSRL
uniref:FAD dependent oxidoreductase domain-containing protein n=1 Tax=Branchiostoma floridae TaxID=7739 RepID=C3ZP76_BRAFL|eukprot:XP_002589562.1 hypothetical protein BRAFLDRAFT_81519 [Branchiostoma floridae]